MEVKVVSKIACYHCGDICQTKPVRFDDKDFCCDGCAQVFDLLKENNLCTYYSLNDAPGISPLKQKFTGKFDYLDDEQVKNKMIRFTDGETSHIVFYVPKIHCSSCIWLLENLHRLQPGIISSSVNFLRKEATIVFQNEEIKLSEIVELMAHIGYEPLISQENLESKPQKKKTKKQVLKIGLAGFCFGNSMMLSFPEYFSLGNFQGQDSLSYLFAYLNLALALPVFFYCASDFFVSAWKSIRYKFLNIDAPIALAILVTFSRSVFEITTHTGAGYVDSMSGIIFFMLIGRYFQDRTYNTLSFERDYKSYFPIGVTLKNNEGKEFNVPVSELKKGDRIIIRNGELIPSDVILVSEGTYVDYSFITGESVPVRKIAGDFIYAGGKQLDGASEMEVVHKASQSYLTQLWNQQKEEKTNQSKQTYVDTINKYFTILVLSIATSAAIYWGIVNPAKSLNAFTAVLIVACPCGLLLTTTFTNGNILRILGRNKFYLKNSEVIEKLANADTIVFDKTGTLTNGSDSEFIGRDLTIYEIRLVAALAGQSTHPLSRQIFKQFNQNERLNISDFVESTGRGLKGVVDGKRIMLGSDSFLKAEQSSSEQLSTRVFLSIDEEIIGYFSFSNAYRKGLEKVLFQLAKIYSLKLLSGDNDSEKQTIQSVFGKKAELFFNRKPDEKMEYIRQLKDAGKKVIMFGDGLNDAGALKLSDVGIAVSDDTNNFTPASDAILDGSSFSKIPVFFSFSKTGKKVVLIIFTISLIYNLIGLAFAVQGILSPVVAAILMPISSVTIVSLAVLLTNISAKVKGL